MAKELPKIEKSLADLAPTRREISARVRTAGAKTLVAALGLLGMNVGAPPTSISQAAQITPLPAIINRKERTTFSNLVLNLGMSDHSQIMMQHRSHASHASHASHVSGVSGGTSTPAAKPAESDDALLLANSEKLTGTITEVQAESDNFLLKDSVNMVHRIYFKGGTKVRILGSTDQTSTIETLRAFTGAVPLRKGNRVTVYWNAEELKKVAVQINRFDLLEQAPPR